MSLASSTLLSNTGRFSGCRVTQSSPPNIGPSEGSAAFDTEVYDVGGYHDNVTNNSRLTVPTTGYYLVTAGIDGGIAQDVGAYIYVRKDGSTLEGSISRGEGNTTSSFGISLSVPLLLTAGSYVELRHNAAGSGASVTRIFFAIHRISPLV